MSDINNYYSEPTFKIDTNYNKNANVSSVKFGEGSMTLEVELNEMQEIQNTKRRELIATIIGNGILGEGEITYSGSILTIRNEKAIVDGEIVTIDNVSVVLLDGDSIYLNVSEKEISERDTIKRFGNEASSHLVANYLVDERIGKVTTRRKAITYSFSSTRSGSSLLFGSAKNGTFKLEATKIPRLNNLDDAMGETIWEDIMNKPESFNPSTHTHAFEDIDDKPVVYPPAHHEHSVEDIVGLPTRVIADGGNADTLGGKAPSDFADSRHTHDASDITGFISSPVESVCGKIGAVELNKSDVGLANVQNFRVASTEEATEGKSDTTYMTPAKSLSQIKANMPLHVRLSNTAKLQYAMADLKVADRWIRDLYPTDASHSTSVVCMDEICLPQLSGIIRVKWIPSVKGMVSLKGKSKFGIHLALDIFSDRREYVYPETEYCAHSYLGVPPGSQLPYLVNDIYEIGELYKPEHCSTYKKRFLSTEINQKQKLIDLAETRINDTIYIDIPVCGDKPASVGMRAHIAATSNILDMSDEWEVADLTIGGKIEICFEEA